MNRDQIYKEMNETLGLVPSFFKSIPDSTLELEWSLFKKLQLEDSPIPQKYRDIMGVGIASVMRCHYCAFFHAESAKLHGATEEEIQNAIQYAKHSAGWSTYLNGSQADLNQFKDEIRQIAKNVRAKMARAA